MLKTRNRYSFVTIIEVKGFVQIAQGLEEDVQDKLNTEEFFK